MRRLLFVLALVAALASGGGVARASCTTQDSPGSFAHETITVSNVSLPFTVATSQPTGQVQAFSALVTIEVDSIRWWADGTAPTAAIGHLASPGQTIEVCGTDNIRNFRMIRVTTDSTVRVSYFR